MIHAALFSNRVSRHMLPAPRFRKPSGSRALARKTLSPLEPAKGRPRWRVRPEPARKANFGLWVSLILARMARAVATGDALGSTAATQSKALPLHPQREENRMEDVSTIPSQSLLRAAEKKGRIKEKAESTSAFVALSDTTSPAHP
jgi:hypothetical protein